MSALRCFAILALLGGAAPIAARADAQADIHAFVARVAPMTFADYVPLHGERLQKGEWRATGTYGTTLSRCLIVDLPSLSSLLGGGGGASEQPYSSALQCDGARTTTTQAALIAMAVKTITPLLPGYTMKRYPASKKSGRSSVLWKNATGQTVDFIAYSKIDYKDHNGTRLGYVINVERLSPETMATPTPSP
ncbi:MAG: hypothetical protein M3R30_03065 [Candidatus Eremiobacteraeota bacterium]|nr:hypothetical protein [Candidatus Eremiobacteraeota bacterium]